MASDSIGSPAPTRRRPARRTSGVLRERTIQSPLGAMVLAASPDGMRVIAFADQPNLAALLAFARRVASPGESPAADELLDRAARLFARDASPPALDGLPRVLSGTPFQISVWSALSRIPRGQTWSYLDLAGVVVGADRAARSARAVGRAVGANPLGVLVPCHRVVGADGSLTGYAGGLERKRLLLAHERADTQPAPLRPAAPAPPSSPRPWGSPRH